MRCAYPTFSNFWHLHQFPRRFFNRILTTVPLPHIHHVVSKYLPMYLPTLHVPTSTGCYCSTTCVLPNSTHPASTSGKHTHMEPLHTPTSYLTYHETTVHSLAFFSPPETSLLAHPFSAPIALLHPRLWTVLYDCFNCLFFYFLLFPCPLSPTPRKGRAT